MTEKWEYKVASPPQWKPFVPIDGASFREKFLALVSIWLHPRWFDGSIVMTVEATDYELMEKLRDGEIDWNQVVMARAKPPAGFQRNPQPYLSLNDWLNGLATEGWEVVSQATSPHTFETSMASNGRYQTRPIAKGPISYTFRRRMP